MKSRGPYGRSPSVSRLPSEGRKTSCRSLTVRALLLSWPPFLAVLRAWSVLGSSSVVASVPGLTSSAGVAAALITFELLVSRGGRGGTSVILFGFLCLAAWTLHLWLLVLHPWIGQLHSSVENLQPQPLPTAFARIPTPISSTAPLLSPQSDSSPTITIDRSSADPVGVSAFGGSLVPVKLRTISVVLPCADERANALNTVDRFCERTSQEHLAEILVVDDGSSPPLKELFEKDERHLLQNPRCAVRIIRHEFTTGLMAAKQTGGKAAVGDVVAFFDCHCSPKLGWEDQILELISENPRRMVVPAITDLDMDTFDEKERSAVNAKCYLTFGMDFKWFDDESDFVPTISGGLVAMGRQWFNATDGFDDQMHGWGGENLDQSLRMWLCGGEIVRAKTSRIAHMWRTSDPRTASHSRLRAAPTNNRGRVAAAWLDSFLPVYRGGAVDAEDVRNFDAVKQRLGCKPFVYFLYRFRRLYLGGGVIPRKVFRLREKASGLCIERKANRVRVTDCNNAKGQLLQLGNVDRSLEGSDACCSGIRAFNSDDCFDYFKEPEGVHFYACDVAGRNFNQQYRLRKDGRIEKGKGDCLVAGTNGGSLRMKRCKDLEQDISSNAGVFEQIDSFEPDIAKIYAEEIQRHKLSDATMPGFPDN